MIPESTISCLYSQYLSYGDVSVIRFYKLISLCECVFVHTHTLAQMISFYGGHSKFACLVPKHFILSNWPFYFRCSGECK